MKLTTVIPVAVNKNTWADFEKMAVSALLHSKGDLVLVVNNTEREYENMILKFTHPTNIKVVFYDQPFNLNGCYNFAMDKFPDTDIYAFANADVLFRENWAANLIRHWEEVDKETTKLICAHTSPRPGASGPSYVKEEDMRHELVEFSSPLFQCFSLLEGAHRFDEQFDFYNTDCDLWLHCESVGKKIYVAQDVRVDHYGGVYNRGVGPVVDSVAESNRKMREKWGNLYKGG